MGANTQIEWAHHTFNPWVGCHKISPGCKHCYAEAWAKRWGRDFATPRVASDRAWKEPLRWNREAAAAGRRERVFCASLADVFEDASELIPARHRLFELINATPSLDWLLLTKRPESAEYWLHWYGESDDAPVLDRWPLRNLWLGVSVEAQPWADLRIPALLRIPAELVAVRFLSCEPLLGAVDLKLDAIERDVWFHIVEQWHPCDYACGGFPISGGLDWVIVGGESGPDARPCDVGWMRSIIEQCHEAGVACFVKQLGAAPRFGEADLWAGEADRRRRDPKGGDPDEWPAGLRVRQFPNVPFPRG